MLTLKQAAILADQEYEAEVQEALGTASEKAMQQIIEREFGDLIEMVEKLVGLFQFDSIALCIIAMRFGMRIQRKLNDPGEKTTVWCGATTEGFDGQIH